MTVVTLLAAAALIAAMTAGRSGAPVETATATGVVEPLPDTAPATATSASSTTVPSSPAATATTSRATGTTIPVRVTTSTTRTPVAAKRGAVRTADRPGLWLVDLADGTLRRIGDEAPFDAAGELLFTAHGADVMSQPLTGGDRRLRYTLAIGDGDFPRSDRAGRIVSIDVAPDGSAVIGTADSSTGADGVTTAGALLHNLYSPDGRRITLPDRLYLTSSSEPAVWSPDGSRLAINFLGRPYLLRADGTVTVGPVPGPPETPYRSGPGQYRWSGDGHFVASHDGFSFSRFDDQTGTWTPISGVQADIDIAADGRMVGPPPFPPGQQGGPDAGLVIVDPAGATSALINRGGHSARWSPDGQWIQFFTTTSNSADNALRVVRPDGTPAITIEPTSAVRFEGPPRWSGSSRYLVVRTTART